MSILARQIRRRFLLESDFLDKFPGDMSPDMASPGTRMPYLVTISTDSIVNYGLSGHEEYVNETLSFDIVANTRAEAEDRLEWVREKLRYPAWKLVPDAGNYVLNYWRLDSFSDGVDTAVEGDDAGIRTVTINISGNYKMVAKDPNSTTGDLGRIKVADDPGKKIH
jgi:hypothetical protein